VLYLDPSVFSHLTQEQLKELEALGAMKAIEILKGYIVNYFKAKKKVEAGKARGRGRGRGKKGGGMGRGGGVVGSSVGGPFTNTPLPARGIHSPGLQDKDQYGKMNGASTSSEVDSKPPIPVPINSIPPMSSLTRSPVMGSLPPPIVAPIPNGNGTGGRGNVTSPILIVDDVDDDVEKERPMAKRRRLDVLDVGMDIEVM
jgi:forkhead box protein K